MQKIVWFYFSTVVFFSCAMQNSPRELSSLLAKGICTEAFDQDGMYRPGKDDASALEDSMLFQQGIEKRVAQLIDQDEKLFEKLQNSSPRFATNDSEEKDAYEIKLQLLIKAIVQERADSTRKNKKRTHPCIGLGITGVVFSAMVSSAATYLLFGC